MDDGVEAAVLIGVVVNVDVDIVVGIAENVVAIVTQNNIKPPKLSFSR